MTIKCHLVNGHSTGIANSDRQMNMIHEMWVNFSMRHDVHKLMLQNPSHIAQCLNK